MQSLLFTPASERQLKFGGLALVIGVIASFFFVLLLPPIAGALPDSARFLHVVVHLVEIFLALYVMLLLLNVLNFHFDYYDSNIFVFILLGLLVAQSTLGIIQIFVDHGTHASAILERIVIGLGVLVGFAQIILAIQVFRALENLQGLLRPLCIITGAAAAVLILYPLSLFSEGMRFYVDVLRDGLMMAMKIFLAFVFFRIAQISPRTLPEI